MKKPKPKNPFIKVRKKEKTVGRMSKSEKILQAILECKRSEIEKELQKRIMNLMLYGTSHPEMWKGWNK